MKVNPNFRDNRLNLQCKRVLVIGLGRTGKACAYFLKRMGAEVIISEAKPEEEIKEALKEMEELKIKVETGGNRVESFLGADLIVLSPGVPLNLPAIKKANELGKKIMSEIELAYHFCKPQIIAITGTNGKSTTTSLLGEIFKNSGMKIFLGGNLGNPMIEMFSLVEPLDYVIVEVSSFQLEAIHHFRPFISILLNITPDHLDRYHSYEEYIQAKAKIFMNQRVKDYAILNGDDLNCIRISREISSHPIFFSTTKKLDKGCYLDGDYLCYRNGSLEELYELKSLSLRGIHNYENIMAAIIASRLCGLTPERIQNTLKQFKGLEHRMELVRVLNGIKFYNDSKGTNVGAVVRSLESFPEKVILIAGGKDKGGDYQILREAAKARLKALILLGEAKEKIKNALGDLAPSYLVKDLEEAVITAFRLASPGDTVLLSPACSSFDMFTNFEERGKIFKQLVHSLPL